MQPVYRALTRFLADEEAHASVEYASVLAMIILTIDVSVASLGSVITNPFWETTNALAAQNAQIAKNTNQGSNSQGSNTQGGGSVQVAGS